MNRKASGHLAALITILIWGTTFISTKVLLETFEPIEILFFRFALGFLALTVVYPRRMPKTAKQQERIFAAAGLWRMPLLPVGKHFPDLYNGFQRGGDHFYRSLLHGDAHPPVYERGRKAERQFLYRICSRNIRYLSDQFQRSKNAA